MTLLVVRVLHFILPYKLRFLLETPLIGSEFSRKFFVLRRLSFSQVEVQTSSRKFLLLFTFIMELVNVSLTPFFSQISNWT